LIGLLVGTLALVLGGFSFLFPFPFSSLIVAVFFCFYLARVSCGLVGGVSICFLFARKSFIIPLFCPLLIMDNGWNLLLPSLPLLFISIFSLFSR